MRAYLIPARGGSKGIPDKNLAGLGGHPLIAWTIEAAAEAREMGEGLLYVSSDDDKILDVAEGYGATAHKRPAHLADDHATMQGVVREFFKAHPEVEDVVLLYPTVPFRSSASIRRALEVYDAGTMAGPYRSLMSVREHRGRPFGGLQVIDGKLVYGQEAAAYYRKQDTPALYFANGAIYIIHREVVDQLNTQLYCAETVPFVMYGHENLDIDTPADLEVARALVQTAMVPTPAGLRERAPMAGLAGAR